MSWWAHQDSNLGPTGYEPVALPTELWAPKRSLDGVAKRVLLFETSSLDNIRVTFELPRAARMLQLLESLRFNLPHSLACYVENCPDFF